MPIKIDTLKEGINFTNAELCEIFQCSPQGGMRRSHKTGTLVIVANHIKSIYEDKWKGDVLHYVGMGRVGDQELKKQNKTLAESNTNGVSVHLFEVYKKNEYTYISQMKLCAEPYQDVQYDENGNSRKVYVFPLKRVNNG